MFKIVLARQGQTMEQGTIVRWLVDPGVPMTVGGELYEIETEKTIVPIEATRAGRIVRVVAQPGDTVEVGSVLAVAAEPGEHVSEAEIDALLAGPADASAPQAAPVAATIEAPTTAARTTKVGVLPKARALAAELAVDLAQVRGSGPDGTIVPDDVRRAAGPARASATKPNGKRRVPMSAVTRSMVTAVTRGWQTPQFTQGIHVDATALVAARRASADLGYTDYFLDAMIRAARAVPDVLARVIDADLEYQDAIDVTVATATDQGLLVPVLRDAGALDLSQRRDAWRALVERARTGRLTADEASGGLLALSNLGTRGVDYGTPLLPVGHALIVFAGSIDRRPIVVGDRLEVRDTLHVAITYDHRVVDGVLGARYTAALRSALLEP